MAYKIFYQIYAHAKKVISMTSTCKEIVHLLSHASSDWINKFGIL
jgi:hypothetical protein